MGHEITHHVWGWDVAHLFGQKSQKTHRYAVLHEPVRGGGGGGDKRNTCTHEAHSTDDDPHGLKVEEEMMKKC